MLSLEMDTKQAVRAHILARRRAMTEVQLAASTQAICAHLLQFAAGYEVIAAYEPFGTEPGVPAFPGVRVLLPLLLPDKDLAWTSGDLSEAQLIVVPGLAADVHGYRLGRGGGSYDRALARSSSSAIRVILLHEGELLAEVPHESHDQKVHFAITPAGVTGLDR
jgi:5-formyltetrahydrofolate cyclo-ligase